MAERRNLIRQALTNRRIVIAPAVRSSGRLGVRSSTQSASSSRKSATPNSRATVARLGEVAAQRAELPGEPLLDACELLIVGFVRPLACRRLTRASLFLRLQRN